MRNLKGPGRPLVPFQHRMEMLGSPRFVDLVYQFNGDQRMLYANFRSDVVFKGGGRQAKDIKGA